jgi:hypothetical protein
MAWCFNIRAPGFLDQNWVVPASWPQRENGGGREDGELTKGLGEDGGDAEADVGLGRCNAVAQTSRRAPR